MFAPRNTAKYWTANIVLANAPITTELNIHVWQETVMLLSGPAISNNADAKPWAALKTSVGSTSSLNVTTKLSPVLT